MSTYNMKTNRMKQPRMSHSITPSFGAAFVTMTIVPFAHEVYIICVDIITI